MDVAVGLEYLGRDLTNFNVSELGRVFIDLYRHLGENLDLYHLVKR